MTPEKCAERLLEACFGRPATIPWPHRLLHEAAAHLEAYAALLAGVDAGDEELADALVNRAGIIKTGGQLSAAFYDDRLLDKAAARLRALSARVAELKANLEKWETWNAGWSR